MCHAECSEASRPQVESPKNCHAERSEASRPTHIQGRCIGSTKTPEQYHLLIKRHERSIELQARNDKQDRPASYDFAT